MARAHREQLVGPLVEIGDLQAELIAGFEDEVDADGHRLVVRNGPELYGLRNACLQLCAASTPWNAAQPMRCAFTSR